MVNLFKTYSLFRLTKTIPTLFGVFTITLHAYGSIDILFNSSNWTKFLMAEASLFFLLCGGYLMNDLLDLKNDMINRPESVYIDSALSRKTAVMLVISLFASSLVLALSASWPVFMVISLQIAALIIYNIFSKKMSYLKPFFITTLFVSIYPLSIAIADGGIAGPRRDSLFIFPVWLFFSVLAYEFICDAKDYKGDSAVSTKGFTHRFGAAAMIKAGRIITVLALPIAFLPYILGMCGLIYMSGAVIALLFIILSLVKPEIDFITILHWVILSIVVSSILDMVILI